jgi:tripartite-type tricarboxylate transporter receptor subunit TctC
MVAALNDAALKQQLVDQGFEIVADTPEQFAKFLDSELARWKRVVEVGKISIE